MNGVVGFADLLKDDSLDAETRNKYIEIIDSNSQQLLILIDDIIDIAKIESGELKVEHKSTNILRLMDNIELTYRELRKQKNKEDVNLILDIPQGLNFKHINTDERRLRQVIINLINNALKFTDEGTIHFGFNVEDNYIKFYVKDTGIGIPEEKLEEIFERFNQVNYNSAKYGGTGLGLSICKGIVELFGGKMYVASTFGEGSTFSFTIPLNVVNASKPKDSLDNGKASGSKKLKGKKLLVAEDTEINQLYLTAILKPLGIEALLANNGAEAVELFKEHKEDIDAILMDLRMPDMNGYEAMEAIFEIDPDAVVIMQTAYAMQDEKEKCIEMGCSEYLTKPLKKETLIEVLEKWT